MSTWTSKSPLALIGALVLAGCVDSLATGPGRPPLTEFQMASGKVTLSTPPGYCIDKRSVRRNGGEEFAVVARCDTLGVRGSFAAHELALITVTTAPSANGKPVVADLVNGTASPEVLDRKQSGGLVLVRFATGGDRVDGVSQTHWRGLFAINGQLVGLGLYAPEGSPALQREGAMLLSELAERIRRASRSS